MSNNEDWRYKGHDKDAVEALAERLLSIWEAKKKSLGLTQTKVAERMNATIGSSAPGVEQSAISQWINGHIPIPEARLIEFMAMLEVTNDEREELLEIAAQQGRPDYDVSQVMYQLTPQTGKTPDSQPQLLDPKFQAVFEMGVLMGITKQGWAYECIQNALDGGYTADELKDAIRAKVFVAEKSFPPKKK